MAVSLESEIATPFGEKIRHKTANLKREAYRFNKSLYCLFCINLTTNEFDHFYQTVPKKSGINLGNIKTVRTKGNKEEL